MPPEHCRDSSEETTSDVPAITARQDHIQPEVLPLRDILGIPVLVANRRDAILTLDTAITQSAPCQIAFLNAHVSNEAGRNAELTRILRSSLVLNDGLGVSIASRVLSGEDFPANLEGTSFTPAYLTASSHSFNIFILGSANDVPERAACELAKLAPQHNFVGTHDGFFSKSESRWIADEIIASGANLVLIGMGSPQQEIWARKWLIDYAQIPTICVGGLLDFVSNEKPRAPRWVRKLRCEWIFRLAVEPARLWRRYLVGNPLFILRLCRAALQGSKRESN